MRLEGKVAFITGAGRGQGRSHAVRMAEEGADIVAIDVCEDVPTCPFPLSSEEDLAETVRLVEETGRGIVARKADVRDLPALEKAVAEGLERFGRLDVVVANACIGGGRPIIELGSDEWQAMIDIGLTGVWHTIKASVPRMIELGNGGSVVTISSAGGLKPIPNIGHYVAAKHGVIGLTKTLANEVAEHNIRVNAICPSCVRTPMNLNDWTFGLFRPDLESPGADDVMDVFKSLQMLDIPWVEPEDVSNAIIFLASEEGRYLTGLALPVDGGALSMA